MAIKSTKKNIVSRLSPYEGIIRLTDKAKGGSQKIKKLLDFTAKWLFILLYKMEFYKLNTNTIHNITSCHFVWYLIYIFIHISDKYFIRLSWLLFNWLVGPVVRLSTLDPKVGSSNPCSDMRIPSWCNWADACIGLAGGDLYWYWTF